MKKETDTLAIVLATVAGFLMIAATMFFSVAQMGAMNNNQIGIENAKFAYENNISLQEVNGELNILVINNNKIADRYGGLAIVFFMISLVFGVISIIFAWHRK